MEKFCIFCGERPVSKTKEHVLPQWLLSVTGDPKRTLKLPFPYGGRDTSAREIAFDALHFPACTECNNGFSKTENNAKKVVEKILQHAPLSATDFDTLLSWLDKVRIGLWLGFLYLGQNPFSISPKFHIAKRTSTKDRAVVIYRADDQRIGLHFQGVNVPMFHHFPSCFTLVINEFYFFNISADFLFARRIGFPYPATSMLRNDGQLGLDMRTGRERFMLPLIRLPFSKDGTEIYQPIFSNEVFRDRPEMYDTAFVRDMSMDWNNGIGWPTYINNQRLTKVSPEPTLDWFPKTAHVRADLHVMTIRQTLTMQADLWDYLYSTTDKAVRKAINAWQRINKIWSKLPSAQLSTLKERPSITVLSPDAPSNGGAQVN